MIQRLAIVAAALLLVPAASLAAPKRHPSRLPKNGSWVGSSDHATYNIRVERHRVVAVYIDATPTVQQSQAGGKCDHQYYGFTGSWLTHDNKTTPRGFTIAEPGTHGFAMDGTFSSPTAMSGSLSLEGGPSQSQSCVLSSPDSFTAHLNTTD